MAIKDQTKGNIIITVADMARRAFANKVVEELVTMIENATEKTTKKRL